MNVHCLMQQIGVHSSNVNGLLTLTSHSGVGAPAVFFYLSLESKTFVK